MTREHRNQYMRSYLKKYLDENPQVRAAISKRQVDNWLAMKIVVLLKYGKNGHHVCCWLGCDASDPDMLSIDHLNDDGAEHREQLTNGKHRAGGGINFYRWLIKNNFPDGYQTLCHNHQWKKEILRRRTRKDECVKS